MDYYQHDIPAYQKATEHLSALEDGVYRRLLDAYYQREGSLPTDLRLVYLVARLTTKQEKRVAQRILQEFFVTENGRYKNKRADEELLKYQRYRDAGRIAAAKRWQSDGNANIDRYIYKEKKPVDNFKKLEVRKCVNCGGVPAKFGKGNKWFCETCFFGG